MFLKILNTSVQHSAAGKLTSPSWPSRGQNAILRSFVATRKNYLFFKRVFDIIFSLSVILLLMSWFVPLVAVFICIDSKGPVFFRQKRIGRNGRYFYCVKFRTMIRNNEADEKAAEENDKRITRVGALLRRTNMDELPQFFNVLAGQMSVVGPRPHMLADCNRFSFVIPSYQFRSVLKPGITGYAQINGYHGPTTNYESIIIRYYWDAQYVRKANAWLDIKIVWATFIQFFKSLLKLHQQTNPNKRLNL